MNDPDSTPTAMQDQPVGERVASREGARSLSAVDPEIARLIDAEGARQQDKLVMIASESCCPAPVREALASPLTNLYAEGYPSSRMAVFERGTLDWTARQMSFYRRYGDRRYYKGCDYVNLVESLAIRRLAELFATSDVPAEAIFANVQALSGAAANNAVYEAFLEPGDTVMGMDLSYGGHLTHGSPVNRSGKRYRIVSYACDPATGAFDWERLEAVARQEAPRLVIAGYSAFPWSIDWDRFRRIADASPRKAILLADIAHPAGLVAAGQFPNPVGRADVISFTTHKTFCGPRGAVLLATDPDVARAVDLAVFPGEQGGPHINTIAAIAVAAKIARTAGFQDLQRRVRENCLALATGFERRGLRLAYGGTDTHLCLVDLKSVDGPGDAPLSADIAARMLDLVGITCNKNAIAGDTSAAHPSGLRFGTAWVTQRGLGPEQMDRIAGIVTDVVKATRAFQVRTGSGLVGRGRIPEANLAAARHAVGELIATTDDGPSARDPGYPHFPSLAPTTGDCVSPLEGLERRLGARPCRHGGRWVPEQFGDPKQEAAAASRSAILCDCFDKGLFCVSGERATAFLDCLMTADVASLKPGLSVRSLILDDRGDVLDDVLLHRLPDDARGFSHYWMSVHAPRRQRLAAYLRALSDGFIDVDRDGDPYRKVDGPVVIEDLAEIEDPGQRRVTLGMAGPKALDVLAAVTSLPDVTQFQFIDTEIAGVPVVVSVGSLDRDAATIELYVHPADAEKVAETLLDAGTDLGMVFAGLHARHVLRRGAGLPVYDGEAPVRLEALGERLQRLHINSAKPWHVGIRACPPPRSDRQGPFTWSEPKGGTLRRTPLFEEHARLTKKWNLVGFAGWEMPVLYQGIVDEHRAVRQAAGLFDVAHMGVFEASGEGAARFLDLVTTNYVLRLRPGQGHYSYVLDVRGSVLDDILVYCLDPTRFMIVVNAANADKIWAWWNAVLEGSVVIDAERRGARIVQDVRLRDLKAPEAGIDRRVDLAFQGPASLPILTRLAENAALGARVHRLGRFEVTRGEIAGHDVVIAKTGYTGEEIGFELYVHPDRAVRLWHTLLEEGRDAGVVPAGLGARDSTRIEAGFPLWGHELAGPMDITPEGAGYGAFVKYHKPFFVGRDVLLQRDAKRGHEIIRFAVTTARTRPLRPDDPLVDPRGRYLGRVTSCSVVAGGQVGLAYVKRGSVLPGQAVGLFALPRQGKSAFERSKAELAEGDSVLLPVAGQVLPRFMDPAEKTDRVY